MSAIQSGEFRRIAALVGYDGTEYCGFQIQPNQPTVQGTLEESLCTFTTMQGRVIGSGRTDTGVHARGQVISLSVHWRHGLDDLCRAWNVHLPPAIVIRKVGEAPDGFHPRFSAESRTYCYYMREGVVREPLSRRNALHVGRRLDLAAMQSAAAYLIGTHDFATFGQPPQGDSTMRTVFTADCSVAQNDLPEAGVDWVGGRRLVFTVTANAFLQHMVRKLVGSLIQVGLGRWTVARFAGALQAANGAYSAPPAAPCGLVLEKVTYPESWRLFAESTAG